MWQKCYFSHICQIHRFRQRLWAPILLCVLPRWRLWQNWHFGYICQIWRFRQLLGAPIPLCALPRWRLWQNVHFRHICQIRCFCQLLCGPYTALCFALLAIVAKLSFSPYLPNAPLSTTFMGPLHSFVLCLVSDCRKIIIFAIFAKCGAFAMFYVASSLLCALPPWRFWQNCNFCHICQIRRFRQLLWAPFTALSFASLANVAKLSFSPSLPISPLSPSFMWPLHCFVLCLLGDCGKIVIFAIFAKFAVFANVYGSLHCFVPLLVGDCDKTVIFAIFAKFANILSFLQFLLLCAFLDISQFNRLFVGPYSRRT